ncbi:MAG: carbon-nitrogen hydrolase family protein [Tepidanaerobacteraceae bacterium]|jgi:nitrilase
MSEKFPQLKVAAVQASPVFLDKDQSTSKACKLIRDAGSNGAKVIVFPEGFIPTHPVWYHFHAGTGSIATKLSMELFKNSVTIPGPEVNELCKAARDAKAYVVMGVCEKLSNTIGTMYNTQIFIGPDGRYLGKHQKIMPTVGERFVHKGGYGDTLKVFNTESGPISGLMCSENSNPLAIMALTAEGTRIHAMAWPNHWGTLSRPMREYVKIASLNFAQVSKAFVISACSTVDERMIEMMQLTSEQEQFIRDPVISGGSMIVAPDSQIIAGPMGDEEGILYADIDLQECVKHKLHHDFSGHYNREDILQLYINRDAPKLYNEYFGKSDTKKDFVCSDSDDDKNCCEQEINVNDNQLDNC